MPTASLFVRSELAIYLLSGNEDLMNNNMFILIHKPLCNLLLAEKTYRKMLLIKTAIIIRTFYVNCWKQSSDNDTMNSYSIQLNFKCGKPYIFY